jgi:CHAT domain-containing protein
MRPRLWWCLTGELGFLPIHAAGVYHGASRACTADYVVSSSTPTLTALAKARGQWTPIPCSEATGILIAEASPPGFSYLPKVAEEVRLVRGCFESAGAKVLNSLLAHTSLSELQSLLESTPAHILHLACHGVQERDPLKSAFMLHGGRLSIEEIMQLNIPSAVLAFLSACQTAKGDRSAPDQAVHLASSMLFCGFRSVVGTMWYAH